MKFAVRDVPGDGNCMFEAVGRQLKVSAKDLRDLVIHYLRTPNQTLQGEPLKVWIQNLDEYTAKMSRQGTWGGGIELAVIANMFHRKIYVYKENGKSGDLIAEFIPKNYNNLDVYVLFCGNNHYKILSKSSP